MKHDSRLCGAALCLLNFMNQWNIQTEMFRRQTFQSGDEADIRIYIREKIAELRD